MGCLNFWPTKRGIGQLNLTQKVSMKIVDVDGLYNKLKVIAEKLIPADDEDQFMVDDYAGGNIDDAYGFGSEAGEVWLARSLLEQYFTGE